MPGIAKVLNKFCLQTLVYWANQNLADQYGRPTFVAPVEVFCRWEDKSVELLMPDGRKMVTKGYILCASPLLVGSLVFLGTLVQIRALPGYPLSPTNVQGAREIIKLNSTPDIKAESYIYEAWLG